MQLPSISIVVNITDFIVCITRRMKRCFICNFVYKDDFAIYSKNLLHVERIWTKKRKTTQIRVHNGKFKIILCSSWLKHCSMGKKIDGYSNVIIFVASKNKLLCWYNTNLNKTLVKKNSFNIFSPSSFLQGGSNKPKFIVACPVPMSSAGST